VPEAGQAIGRALDGAASSITESEVATSKPPANTRV